MKKILVVIAAVLMSAAVNAQDFELAVGLRGGLANGLTGKKTMGEGKAIEAILSTYSKGFVATGLIEFYKPAFGVDGLNWFYGGGAHVGFWSGSTNPWSTTNSSAMVAGIDGIIGLEFKIPDIPFHIGVDYKPAINLIGNTGFWWDGGGLSIRYIIK